MTQISGRALAAVQAVDHLSLASHDRSGRALEVQTTAAGEVVIDNRAERVRPANALDFARVVTSVLNAGLTGVALEVVAAADVAVALRDTGLVRRTTVVDYASFDAKIIDTALSRGALCVQSAHESALTVNAGLTVTTVGIGSAKTRYSSASAQRVGLSSEVVGTDAFGLMVSGDADRVRTALQTLAGILAQEGSGRVGNAGRIRRTVPVAIGT